MRNAAFASRAHAVTASVVASSHAWHSDACFGREPIFTSSPSRFRDTRSGSDVSWSTCCGCQLSLANQLTTLHHSNHTTVNYTTLYNTTVHYTTVHCITPYYTSQHFPRHNSLYHTTPHYTTHLTTLHYTALPTPQHTTPHHTKTHPTPLP